MNETIVNTKDYNALIENVKHLKELNKEYIELGYNKSMFKNLTSDEQLRYEFLETQINRLIIHL